MTEDQLAEQAEVMMQLGADSEGSEIRLIFYRVKHRFFSVFCDSAFCPSHHRAKMQSASLLSDMESFKAANPGAVLGDFVRWHSPRDWEEGDGEGQVRVFTQVWKENYSTRRKFFLTG